MADLIRWYMDEHVPRAVAQGLRRRGVDVQTTQEAGMLHAPTIFSSTTPQDKAEQSSLKMMIF